MTAAVRFDCMAEDQPGERWRALFERLWPGYRAWYLRGGVSGRPGYLECRRALRQHMPELLPVWERLVELSGGGDVESRFLSLWCPPPYIAGCSQAVWFDASGHDEPALVRNYDFAPALLEGQWMCTRWCGQRVMAMGDCTWGALDGLNEAGLAASISFGGRTVSGDGFGIPLVLRHVLETAESTAQAVRLLQRIPVSMCYSVTLLDRRGEWATVFVAPDRTTEVTAHRVVTNFQHRVEWTRHATATHAVARHERLRARIEAGLTLDEVAQSLLVEPLYQTEWDRGYGTLYSAVYRPASGRATLMWPGTDWEQSLDGFTEGHRDIVYGTGPAPPLPASGISFVQDLYRSTT